jgi:large subunit ribosomal protein L5
VRLLSRLKDKYSKEVVSGLKNRFGYSNVMQIPEIKKVVINMGVGEATGDAKAIDAAVGDLIAIAGQKPVVTKAKKSISAFKLRAGVSIGCKVTLRGERMYYFLDKLFNLALPRIRDFRGISPKSFDGRGNYTLGVRDQLIFPEINYDKVDKIRGMDIVIVTSARTDEEAFELLKLMGMPFRAQ